MRGKRATCYRLGRVADWTLRSRRWASFLESPALAVGADVFEGAMIGRPKKAGNEEGAGGKHERTGSLGTSQSLDRQPSDIHVQHVESTQRERWSLDHHRCNSRRFEPSLKT
jgi:hypothetical protein